MLTHPADISCRIEVVIAIAALRKCELRVVQSSLVGAMLSKLLLVLGMCFFAGGLRFTEQDFNPTANQINSSLLTISVSAVLLPAVFHFVLSGATAPTEDETNDIMRMSHGVSIILLIIYASYLVFQLWSHKHLYKDNEKRSEPLTVRLPKVPSTFVAAHKQTKSMAQSLSSRLSLSSPSLVSLDKSWQGEKTPENWSKYSTSRTISSRAFDDAATLASPGVPRQMLSAPPMLRGESSGTLTSRQWSGSTSSLDTDASLGLGHGHPSVRLVTTNFPRSQSLGSSPGSASPSSTACSSPLREEYNPDEISRQPADEVDPANPEARPRKLPKLSLAMNLTLLILIPVIVSVTVDRLVESMDEISSTVGKAWIGLILLPAVASVAECMSAINTSVKDQLTFSINLAVGSTVQTALLIIPFMVTLAWAMGKPLSLLFDPFESVVLYISVQTMTYVVADGKSNWLEGFILICLYVLIAVAFWYYPGSAVASSIAATCREG
ncbi:hypothetical protein HGRIS_003821 [Hohenbuehelia grisea]|uniref:Sodium/calcium exchanger membrane region domain-containing protein n=1 Tax=Hohenbuehelia grisea TaxID=104357 RepID=A0ABR3JGM5_9AGAR